MDIYEYKKYLDKVKIIKKKIKIEDEIEYLP